MGHIGAYWGILGQIRAYWGILGHNIEVNSGKFWKILGILGQKIITWSKNTLNDLKHILKQTCFFHYDPPNFPFFDHFFFFHTSGRKSPGWLGSDEVWKIPFFFFFFFEAFPYPLCILHYGYCIGKG